MSIGELATIGIIFVVVTVVISIGADIVGNIRTSQTSGDYANNVSTSGLDALAKFGSWLPTLAIVIVASIIIGVIATYFATGRNR